ncbi:hypothetical protein BDZ89DRAFT_1135451 [Hymenopellis radicata]|nr:hypothetical protein BDZ89DRAFT_1135451 [Hymenopellis radicata]
MAQALDSQYVFLLFIAATIPFRTVGHHTRSFCVDTGLVKVAMTLPSTMQLSDQYRPRAAIPDPLRQMLLDVRAMHTPAIPPTGF